GGRGALALFRFLFRAADSERKGARLHLVRGDPRTQIGVGDLAVILSDIVERGVLEIVTLSAAAPEAARRDILALVLQQALAEVPAAVQFSDQLRLRDLHVGEEGLAEG